MTTRTTVIKKRTLGQGLEVSAIGLGCMSMTGGYSDRPDHDEMVSLIRAAADRGVITREIVLHHRLDTGEAQLAAADHPAGARQVDGTRRRGGGRAVAYILQIALLHEGLPGGDRSGHGQQGHQEEAEDDRHR